MAQRLSEDLHPEIVFPGEFPYEVVDTLPSDSSDEDDNDSVYLDYNLFFPGLALRRLTHSSIFNGVPIRCDGIPVRWHAREVEFVEQRHDSLLLAQRRQLQIQAQIRAKKLGSAEGSIFVRASSFPQPGWASKAVSAGTGVFLPRGYRDVARESRQISVGPTPRVVVPAKAFRSFNNAHVPVQGRGMVIRTTPQW